MFSTFLIFSGIYKRSHNADPDIPVPDGHGWRIGDGELKIHWMKLPPTPDNVEELVNCSGKCKDANICSCLQNNMPCTDLSKCSKDTCCEITGYNALGDSDDDDDDSDNETLE